MLPGRVPALGPGWDMQCFPPGAPGLGLGPFTPAAAAPQPGNVKGSIPQGSGPDSLNPLSFWQPVVMGICFLMPWLCSPVFGAPARSWCWENKISSGMKAGSWLASAAPWQCPHAPGCHFPAPATRGSGRCPCAWQRAWNL